MTSLAQEKSFINSGTLDLLRSDGEIGEVRIIFDGKTPKVLRSTNLGDLEALAEKWDGRAKGIYTTLNPIKSVDLDSPAAKDGDIVKRSWLLVDCDPERPTDTNATDAEKSAAWELAETVADFLTGLGWPRPVVADSGNGYHLLYRIDLPADDGELVKGVLAGLAERFNRPGVKIDGVNYNASRITKLYGTVARKGPDTPDRPHRRSAVLDVPEPLGTVSPSQLRGVAVQTEPERDQNRAQSRTNGHFPDPEPYDLEARILPHLTGLKPQQNGDFVKSWRFDCPWDPSHKGDAFLGVKASGALIAKCHHDSCKGHGWDDLRAMYDPKPVYVNGSHKAPDGVQVTPDGVPATAADLEIPDGADPEAWVLDNLDRIAYLDPVEVERLKIKLRDAGASKTYLDRDFRRILKGIAKSTPEDLEARVSAALAERGYSLRLNTLDDSLEVNGERLTDSLEARVLLDLYGSGLRNADWVRRAMLAIGRENSYHPIRDFFSGLVWDGVDRIAQLERCIRDAHAPIDYADGSRKTAFGAYLERWGIGAVAKIMRGGDGLHAQNFMLVLAGRQNLGKSTFAQWLNPLGSAFFIESAVNPGDKDHDRYAVTKFVWEVAELGATTRKADREALKSFLTRTEVTIRPAYARNDIQKPTTVSFVGTINPDVGFLNDSTGNRRFVVCEISDMDHAYAETVDVIQLWAQFAAKYRAGEPWRLTREETEVQTAIQRGHEVEDPILGYIDLFFDLDAGPDDFTTTAQIGKKLSDQGIKTSTAAIGIAMRRAGNPKASPRINGRERVGYYRVKERPMHPNFR